MASQQQQRAQMSPRASGQRHPSQGALDTQLVLGHGGIDRLQSRPSSAVFSSPATRTCARVCGLSGGALSVDGGVYQRTAKPWQESAVRQIATEETGLTLHFGSAVCFVCSVLPAQVQKVAAAASEFFGGP